jgi:hypothetical protein
MLGGTMTSNGACLDYLDDELTRLIEDTDRHRRKEKRIAFWLRVAVVAFSGTITVLLGLQLDGRTIQVLSNIALVLGAAITVLTAIDAFYNYRALYIHRTVQLERLSGLRRRVRYLKVAPGREEEVAIECKSYFTELRTILEDGLRSWRRLRGDSDVEQPAEGRESGPGGPGRPEGADPVAGQHAP